MTALGVTRQPHIMIIAGSLYTGVGEVLANVARKPGRNDTSAL